MQELNKRNTETVEQALKDIYDKIYKMQESLNHMNNTFVAIYERMNKLEQQLIIQKVQLVGLGPSVRENK
jgi:prefoldin subunit 5